ncbi:hypothetical protein ACHAWF_018689 [Thalassiosira exigua]
MQGWRKSMEDTHVTRMDVPPPRGCGRGGKGDGGDDSGGGEEGGDDDA